MKVVGGDSPRRFSQGRLLAKGVIGGEFGTRFSTETGEGCSWWRLLAKVLLVKTLDEGCSRRRLLAMFVLGGNSMETLGKGSRWRLLAKAVPSGGSCQRLSAETLDKASCRRLWAMVISGDDSWRKFSGETLGECSLSGDSRRELLLAETLDKVCSWWRLLAKVFPEETLGEGCRWILLAKVLGEDSRRRFSDIGSIRFPMKIRLFAMVSSIGSEKVPNKD